MRLFKQKIKIFSKIIVIVATLFLMSTIVAPTNSNAELVKHPDIGYLDEGSPIVLEFDKLIQWNTALFYYSGWAPAALSGPNNTHYGISLTETSTGNLVVINMAIIGNKLFITPISGSTWDKNTEYKLIISDHIVKELGLGSEVLPSDTTQDPVEYTIGTYFLTFEELMSGSRKINTIIRDYTPRNINVTSPKRYVEEVSIIHKRQDLVQGSTTESVTNVDVSIKDPTGDVKRIAVTPKMNGSTLQIAKGLDNLNLTVSSRTTLYDFGFTRLPDTSAFDFEVILYDNNDDPVDKRIIKVPFEASTTTTIKQRDRYRFADKTFTLYHLLNRPGDLQTLLEENRMDEIKVRVVQN